MKIVTVAKEEIMKTWKSLMSILAACCWKIRASLINTFGGYKATLIMILLWTVSGGISFALDILYYQMPEHAQAITDTINAPLGYLFSVILFWGFGVFFLEIRYEGSRKKTLLCILWAPLAIMVDWLVGTSLVPKRFSVILLAGYLLGMIFLIACAAYRRYGKSIPGYILQVIFRVIVLIFMWLVAYIVFSDILQAILRLDEYIFIWDWSAFCGFITIGFVFLPGCIWALQSNGEIFEKNS